MTKDPNILLQHILESINLVETRTRSVSRQEFEGNADLQDMVIRRLEIIGEAARNLPDEFRNNNPSVRWQGPIEMRNFLIHAYFDVDPAIVWDTVVNDLPPFKKAIEELLERL